ncbi:MAG TPA: alpha/beta fold hydrolase [Terriglobales bacterium]
MSMRIQPFSIPYSEVAVRDLRDRLARTRWPDAIPGSGWDYGADMGFMRDICAYWQDQFDWKAEVDRMSELHHYRYEANGFGLHFVHEKGNVPRPLPLVQAHGWPGSFLEFQKIIPMLTQPERFGAGPEDAFDVVVPSLPGFGYSDRPIERGFNTFRMAQLLLDLMQELGYSRFGAQGGDFGANISTVMALRHPERLIGIHLNYIPGSYYPHLEPGAEIAPVEREFLQKAAEWEENCGGYLHLQATQPQTLAYSLNDSPAGLAAWILEKFRSWADCDGDLSRRFTTDELLTNVTLYWMTETIHSSCRLYYETTRAPLRFAKGDYVRVPCAIAHFPKEEPFPPRPWIERGYNIQHWTEMPAGGHFAAAEEPALLAQDIRNFFRPFRSEIPQVASGR